MDPQVFYEVLVPLMEVEGTATICISTPLGQFNFYSELTEVRDENGRRIFNVLHIPGTCKECGGASICEHGRLRHVCKECGGVSICEHGRRRHACKECGGASICEHGKRRGRCKHCLPL